MNISLGSRFKTYRGDNTVKYDADILYVSN